MNEFRVDSAGGNVSPIIAAAHELKSPIALVRQLSLMLNSDDDISDSEKKLMLNQIQLTSERALRLTSDLTKSSRLEDAMFSLEPINPIELCKEIAYELKPLMDMHSKSLKVKERKKHSLLLIGNRDLLRRIVMNFADNAIHYTDENKIIEMAITSLNKGSTIRLSVRDYGPAMKKDYMDKIRSKLEKSPQNFGARPQSSGIGLYVSSKFAEAMNGNIGVLRHRDGATFYVDLHASSQLSII
jgi:signal transduction histidine kinase